MTISNRGSRLGWAIVHGVRGLFAARRPMRGTDICSGRLAPSEDLVQTPFTSCTSRTGFSRHAGWTLVRQIMVRSFIDERRRAGSGASGSAGSRPNADTARLAENRLLMLAALSAVPPRQRAVLVLRYWEDLSIEESAALLGCSTGTVKSQAARGLDTLRSLLSPTHSGTGKGQR